MKFKGTRRVFLSYREGEVIDVLRTYLVEKMSISKKYLNDFRHIYNFKAVQSAGTTKSRNCGGSKGDSWGISVILRPWTELAREAAQDCAPGKRPLLELQFPHCHNFCIPLLEPHSQTRFNLLLSPVQPPLLSL